MADAKLHPSACAQALTNPDILHGIFMFIPLTSKNRDSYLAQCAVVCRTFHGSVIRILWRAPVGLFPLWQILAPASVSPPFHGVEPFGGKKEQDVLSYLQAIKSAQLYRDPALWDRFLWHTAYIREMHHKSASQAIDDENRLLLQAVTKQNGGRTVLPLLHAIDWRGLDPSDNALIPLFTSRLRHLTLDFHEEFDDAVTFDSLRGLHESSPVLEEIVLNLDADPLLIQELAGLPRLHHIGISRISGSQVQTLLGKPNLTELSVAEVTGPWVDLDRTISIRDLRELFIGGSVSAMCDLFNVARFQALKSATVHITAPHETPLEIAEFTNLLAQFYAAVSASGLHSLEFMLQGPINRPANYLVLRDLVAPILPLASLRSFTLFSMDTLTAVGDADIAALTGAWPTLERLCIQRAGCTTESGVSIHGIHHLHTHSPNLRELSVPSLRFPVIGVDQIPAPLSPNRSPPPALRRLYVPSQHVQVIGRPSRISEEAAEALARYLLDLFPSLEGRKLTPAQAGGEGLKYRTKARRSLWAFLRFEGLWAKVEGHVHAIRAAREAL